MSSWKTVLLSGMTAQPRPGPHSNSPARKRPADPYACWAIATGWRGYARSQQGAKVNWPLAGHDGEVLPIRILARAGAGTDIHDAVDAGYLTVPAVYLEHVPGASEGALHFTATVSETGMDWLCSEECKLHWELAAPIRPALTLGQADVSGRAGPQRDESDFRTRPAPQLDDKICRSVPSRSIGDAIAIIDFGCPFLNARLCGPDGKSRVAALWDQDERRMVPEQVWRLRPDRLGYGRELSGPVMQALGEGVRQAQSDFDADEATLYRRLEYLVAYDDPRRRTWFATHGAHVLDIAGGTVDPLASVVPALVEGRDAASKAALVFVQLPALTAADASGGSLGAQVLDAVRYVLDRCDPDRSLVLNISYGTFAGPHDGSSMLERALDELLSLRKRNFTIVLAAGNARLSSCHLRRTVRKNRSALLRLELVADDATDTFVEIWYELAAASTVKFPGAAAPRLRARVRTVGRDWSGWVENGGAEQLNDAATHQPLAVLQHALAVPQSLKKEEPKPQRALILLALAATAPAVDDDGPLNEAGCWEIEVALVEPAGDHDEVLIDAWVERDDPGEFGSGATPRFTGTDRDDQHHTLSSIATGQYTIVVGGYRLEDGGPAPYSSLPQAQTPGTPRMIYAPCEESAEVASLPAAAVCSNDLMRMNGTSVAAPVAARRLFNAMMNAGRSPVLREDWPALLKELADDPRSLLRNPV